MVAIDLRRDRRCGLRVNLKQVVISLLHPRLCKKFLHIGNARDDPLLESINLRCLILCCYIAIADCHRAQSCFEILLEERIAMIGFVLRNDLLPLTEHISEGLSRIVDLLCNNCCSNCAVAREDNIFRLIGVVLVYLMCLRCLLEHGIGCLRISLCQCCQSSTPSLTDLPKSISPLLFITPTLCTSYYSSLLFNLPNLLPKLDIILWVSVVCRFKVNRSISGADDIILPFLSRMRRRCEDIVSHEERRFLIEVPLRHW